MLAKFYCPRCNKMRDVTIKRKVKIKGRKYTRCEICRPITKTKK